MKKKSLCITLIAIAAAAALAGCGGNSGSSSDDATAEVEQDGTQEENDAEAEEEDSTEAEEENSTEADDSDDSGISSGGAREIVSYGGSSTNGMTKASDNVCIGDGVIYYVTPYDSSGKSALCSVNLDGSGYSEVLNFSSIQYATCLNYYNGSVYYLLRCDTDATCELRCLDESGDRSVAEFEREPTIQIYNDDLFYVLKDQTEISFGVFDLSSEEQTLLYAGESNGTMLSVIDTDGTYIYFFLTESSTLRPYRVAWDSIYDETVSVEEIDLVAYSYDSFFADNGFYTVITKENGEDMDFVYYDYANIVSGSGGFEWTPTVILEDIETDWYWEDEEFEEERIETLFWNGYYKFALDGHFIALDLSFHHLYCSDSLDYTLSTCIDDDFGSDLNSLSHLCIFEYDGLIYYFDSKNGGEDMVIHSIDANGNIE
ncbi:MAG: hypothetical protein LUE92_02020 [Clostridiales bacterium]|nr:hypothetical protein [Clostridiales bacterium]